jgi:hypothetical protein
MNEHNIYIVHEVRNVTREPLVFPKQKSMIWHQRLGHIGGKGIQDLHSKFIVKGISNYSLDFDFLEHCAYGKHYQLKLSTGIQEQMGFCS